MRFLPLTSALITGTALLTLTACSGSSSGARAVDNAAGTAFDFISFHTDATPAEICSHLNRSPQEAMRLYVGKLLKINGTSQVAADPVSISGESWQVVDRSMKGHESVKSGEQHIIDGRITELKMGSGKSCVIYLN